MLLYLSEIFHFFSVSFSTAYAKRNSCVFVKILGKKWKDYTSVWGEVKSLSRVWLCHPVDCNLLGFSVHGVLQARILEWIAISFSRGSSRPRDETRVSPIGGRHFNLWATREDTICCLGQEYKDKALGVGQSWVHISAKLLYSVLLFLVFNFLF